MDMENAVSKEENDCLPLKSKSEVLSRPVSPGARGKGLPYAPVDWPNVGDIWCWKVGSRVKDSGFYRDRVLYAPKILQERPTKKLLFLSKLSVSHYLKSTFPEADIDAFFASFTWHVPAEAQSSKIGKVSSNPQASPSEKEAGKMVRGVGVFEKARKAASKKPGWKSCRQSSLENVLDVPSVEEQIFASDPTVKVLGTSPVSGSHASVFPVGSACHSPIDLKPQGLKLHDESQAGLTSEDFDTFLNSLDEILCMPIGGAETSTSASSQIEGVAGTRAKISSLVAMGFASLVVSNKINELNVLTSELKNDPTLRPEELSMLKLMEEIPMNSNSFLEARKLSKQADKFFADLDAKLANVASLRTEYSVAKQQLELSQAEEASALSTLCEIDEQIAALQSRRRAITETVKMTNTKIVQCFSSQKRVMECLPKFVHEVQVANSEKKEWELKKKESAEEEAEILAKFAPLEGFSF